jgi:hypothetical protein
LTSGVFIIRQTISILKITQTKRKKKMAWGMKLINETPAVIEVQCFYNPAGTGVTYMSKFCRK